MKFAVITFPYSTDTDAGTAAGPKALLQAGLTDWLCDQGHDVAGPFHVQLAADEEAAYGSWNKIGVANAHFARLVSGSVQEQAFPLLLESNCYAAVGALAGLQMSAGLPSPRLGMIWIDAHGDCNTPESTLSGMLSGLSPLPRDFVWIGFASRQDLIPRLIRATLSWLGCVPMNLLNSN
jgi:arginase